jgi:predicted nucleotidyltransferase
MARQSADEGRPFDREVVSLLQTHVRDLQAVYRFGSSVANADRPDSDVDLAILAARPLAAVERFDIQERLAAALRRDVDLVDLRSASTVMASQIITTGMLLYEGDAPARHVFEDFIYGRYARLNEERRGILERIAREGSVYGG